MASKFTITAELSLQTKNLNQVVRNLQSQFNNANLNIKIKDLAQAQSHIQKISSSSKQASKDVGVLGNSMEQAFKRFTVITAVTGTLIAFTRAVKRSINEAIDFEREVVKIAQATGQTVSQLRGLTREIDSVSTTFGVASKELILSARSLTQAGFAADKVAGSLKVLAQTELAATFDSIQDTTEGAIALLNQFGKTAQKTGSEVKFLEQSFSAINQVSKEFAVESSDLVTAIRTTGAAFESAGGNLNELLALFTSVRSTTRESAESIATGFRTIFTRVQRVDTINALRNLGVELQDAEGKFIGPMEAIKRLSTALNTIDPKDFRFNMVVEELGGFRQVSKVIPLIQQFATTQKALNVAQNSSGSLAKDATTAQQALAVQIAKTREEFQKFMREMVASETFQSTVRTLLDLASAFIKVADSVKPLIPLIATFGAMKAGAALVPALRSFAGSGKRGGIPIGFATGGLVPGSGNGDTVPAMLSPGEFVIRKSSVNKIGANKLAGMNNGGSVQRFANGGRVTLIPKANRYGIFALEPEGEDDKDNYSTGVKVKNKDVTEQLRNKFNLPKDSEVAIGGFLKSFHIGNDAQNNVRQTFKDSTEKSFSRMITDVSNDVSKKVGSKPVDIESSSLKSAITSLFNQDSKSARSAIEGYVLEGVSSAISGAELAGGQERWDFPNPAASANGLAKLFGKEQEIAALNKGDVKRTDNSEARSDVRSNKLARTLLENPEELAEIIGDKAYTPKKIKSSEGTLGGIVDKLASKYEGVKFEDGSVNGAKISRSTISNILKQIPEMRVNVGVNDPVDEKLIEFIENNIGKVRKKYLGGLIQEFASGGFASGSDTVPAMLTPGEFVVNKKSAQRIGYSNLNRINKVAKFANGGTVGKGGSPFDPSQQGLQASLFLGQYGQIISPQQRKLLEGTINGMINAGLDAEKAMKQMARDIDVRKRTNLLGSYLGAGDIKEKRTKYLNIAKGGADEKRNEAAKANAEYVGKLRELSDSSGKATTNMLILAGITESVVSQFTSMSESSKAWASAFGASLAIYSGVSSQLKSLGTSIYASILESKKESVARSSNTGAVNTNTAAVSKNSSVNRLQKSFSLLEGVLTGFSVGMAAASAAAAYMAKEAEIASKNMSDTINKFKEDFKSVSQAQLKESISRSFLSESRSKIVGGGLSSKKSIGMIASGAAGGAGIGAAFGGAPGALVGGIIGGVAGFLTAQKSLQMEFEKTKDKIGSSATTLADTLYQTSKSIIDVKKFIDESKNKNLLQISTKTTASVNEYARSVASLKTAEEGLLDVFKTFGEIPEVLRNGLDDAAQSVGLFKNEIDKLVGLGLSKAVSGISSNIGLAGFSPDKAIQDVVNNERGNIARLAGEAVKQRFNRTVSGFEKQGLNAGSLSAEINSQAAKEGEKAVLEFTKQLAESTVQVLNQNLAMSKELKIREALLGALSKQLALESQISNSNYSLERDAQNSRMIEAVYSGVVSGLKSNTVSSSILDVTSPAGQNGNDFSKALKIIGDFSPFATSIKDSISEFSKVSSNLDMVIESINLSQFEGEPANRKIATEQLIKDFGVKSDSESANAIRLAVEKTFDVAFTGAKEGGFSKKERQDLLKTNLLDPANKAKDPAKAILDIALKIESATREYRDKILQSQQKEIEIRLSAIDAQKNYLDLIQKVTTGKGLTLQQNDTARLAKQQTLVGRLAGNPSGIGNELKRVRESLKQDGLTDSDRQGLQNKAKKLEMALADLADQSSRTSDIMSKIDEFKAQRETLSESAKDYAFGTKEDRAKTDQSFGALKTVLGFGDINAVSDELKGSVKELLTRFKDIPLFNGMTGSQIENELSAREFQKSGNFDIAAMLRSQTSTPEQKLIAELKKTSEVEMVARAEMLSQEQIYQQENTNAIITLTNEIKTQGIAAIGKQAQNERLIAKQQAAFGKAPSEDVLNRDMKSAKAIVDFATAQIDILGKSIESLIAKINEEIANLSKIAKDKESGFKPNKDIDVVRRAGGGIIFKPKGTDTVPAMLTPGEFVVRKQAVDKIGLDTLNQINTGYFSRGGKTRTVKSQSGLEKTITDVRGYDRRAERMRRESSEYAASYAASTDNSRESARAASDLYRSYNQDSYQVPKMSGVEKMGEFVNKLEETAKTMNGMSMTHHLTVDGQLNIAGIDGRAIAAQVSQALGTYVGNIVQQHLNKQNSRPGT